MKSLRNMKKEDGKTVVITLHQVEYARKYCKRAIALVEGNIAFDGPIKNLTDDVLHDLYGTAMTDDDDDFEPADVVQMNPQFNPTAVQAG
jgi:phosphonate transport system ATP-binding protein